MKQEFSTPNKNTVFHTKKKMFSKVLGHYSERTGGRSGYQGEALVFALWDWNIERVRAILDSDRDLVHAVVEGNFPLHVASVIGFEEAVEVLIAAGAPVDEINFKTGDTALMLAVQDNNSDVAKRILKAGANPNAVNFVGQTALHVCVERGYIESVDVLLADEKCNRNMQDHAGDTPLHLAIRNNCPDIVQLLVSHPAIDPCLKNNNGVSAIELATKRQDDSCIRSIRDRRPSLVKDEQDGEPVKGNTGHPQPNLLDDSFRGFHKITNVDQELELLEKIGSGSFGSVHEGLWRGTRVAIKVIPTTGSEDSVVLKEVNVHRRALHPNIVQLIAFGQANGRAHIVMNFINGHNLYDVIFKEENPLTFEEKLSISRNLLSALTFLHASGILHLDIKPLNILIERKDRDVKPYICDLGLALLKRRSSLSTSLYFTTSSVGLHGTLRYLPPESFDDDVNDDNGGQGSLTWACDVWSMAGSLLEMFTSESLWPNEYNMYKLIRRLSSEEVTPDGVKSLPLNVRRILEPCFEKNPKSRPSAEMLLDEFNGVE